MTRDREKYLAYQAEYKKRPEAKAKRAERSAKELQDDPARIKANLAAMRKRNKEQAYEAYGNQCACCGESEVLFLTLDHVDNDGGEHRKQIRSTDRLYVWARKNGYPPNLQLLCWNCNLGKYRNGGACPHQIMERDHART